MADRIGVRLGVLGAGDHSMHHHGAGLHLLAQRCPQQIQVAAVCDLDQEKAVAYAKLFGFEKTYTNLEAMLDSERLDGLIAITPVPATAEIVECLLPHGIALMIEKPPGQSSKEAQQLSDLAARHCTPHIVSFDRRFSPAMCQAQQWLENHAGAPPNTISAVMRRVQRTEPDFCVGTGIHLIDTVLSLMGPPVDYVIQDRPLQGTHCPGFSATVDFDNGRLGVMEISPDAGTVEETYTLTGPGYTVCIDTLGCRVQASEHGRETFSWTAPPTMSSAEKDGAVNEADAFVALVETRRETHPTLADAVMSMLIAESIQKGTVD